jgi:uncharacterized cofD-like protein
VRAIGISLKWFAPGMRVKRWVVLAAVGAFVILLGVALLNHGHPVDLLSYANRFWGWAGRRAAVSLSQGKVAFWTGIGVTALGVLIVLFALSRLSHSVTSALDPGGKPGSLVDTVYRNRFLSQGARVVVIGGGTGLSTMLRGIKQYTSNIVAVVTVTDDGGSSGKLTRQLNILPPGDIRNCLVALADSEATMTDLFQHRFRGSGTGEGLRDHAFGNLLIAAMCEISGGDFEQAVRQTSRVLNIRGRVLPSTLTHVSLRAQMEDGSIIEGETNIAHSPLKVRRVTLCPDDVQPLDEVIEAIELADVIIVGPGSVYTSVIPNLLVKGIPEALDRSKAKKVYICNVMTQPGETDGFAASDHLKALESHVGRPVVDYVMVNTGMPSHEMMERYGKSGAVWVEPDADRVKAMGYKPIRGNFISQTDVVRHDAGALTDAIVHLLLKEPRA